MVLVVEPGIAGNPHPAFPVLLLQHVVVAVYRVDEGAAAAVDSDEEGATR
jgi:hypothetical protein